MPKEQQYTKPDGSIIYVTMPDDVTYETRRQPTAAEYATAKNALPSGTWTVVEPGTFGATRIVAANPGTFTVGVEWSNGKARIVLLTQPTKPGGENLYIWTTGQLPQSAFPTSYDYFPGDSERVYVAYATSTDLNNSPLNTKAVADIYFGSPS